MNRNCMFNHELLVSYVSGNVTPSERSTVERHLAGCAECRQEVVELESTWWALDTWQMESAPAKPRLADLRQRLDRTRQVQPFWTRAWEQITLNIPTVKPIPALAVATFASVIFLVPWMQSAFNPTAPVTSNNVQANQTIAQATPVPETDTAIDRKELEFKMALSGGDTADRDLDRLIRVRRDDPNSMKVFANFGFSPSKDVYEESSSPSTLRPSTVQLANYGETVSFE